jgi:GlcNAc-P-P-Und epimerase
MARILITGGSGFIGTNLVEHYCVQGDQIINLDIAPPRNPHHAQFWRKTNILDRAGLASAISDANPEIVFHMAARTDLRGKSISDYSTNTYGVSNLIQALQTARTLRFTIFASSMLVCSIGYRPKGEMDYCPTTAYGESKVAGEQLVRKEAGRLPWIIVRPTSIWGPWFGTPYRDFFIAVQQGLYMHPWGRRIHRSYGFVMNSVTQLDHLAKGGTSLLGRTVYLADYEPIELKNWADTIQRALGVRPIREVPLCLLRMGAIGGDILNRLGKARPALNSFRLNNLLTEMIHDTDTLRSACGNLPFSMEQGVQITCDWLRHNPV